METYEKEGSLCAYMQNRISPEQLAYMDRKEVESMSNIYYAFSVATFGLPQTTKHLCSKVMDLIVHDRNKHHVGLDIGEIVLTGGMIVGQVILMYKVYSMLP